MKIELSFASIDLFLDNLLQVNDEIKGYISVHKHDLMSGMQDVAVLATRYQTLQSVASRVRAALTRLKKEVFRICFFIHVIRLLNSIN